MFGMLFAFVLGLTSWVYFVLCMKGYNKVFLVGKNKEMQKKYSARYKLIEMNRFIGFTIFLPIAGLCTAVYIIILVRGPELLLGMLLGLCGFTIVMLCISTISQILGGRFRK